MNNTMEYTDELMEIGKVVHILPAPIELAHMVRTEETTFTLTKPVLDSFRKKSKK